MKLVLQRVVTQGRTFIPEVDGLRFVAITAVVMYHMRGFTISHSVNTLTPVGQGVSSFLGVGHYGVELFFILSGFLLALPFAKWRLGLGARPSLRTYYLRRLTRLEPPYLVAMVMLFFVGVAVHMIAPAASKWPSLGQWPHLLATLVYQHNLVYGDTSIVTPVVWSLEIEVQFYLLAPFLSTVFSIRHRWFRRILLVVAILAIPIVRSFLPADFGQRFNSLPWNIEYFLAGFLLADIFLVEWREQPAHSRWGDICSVIGWPALFLMMRSGWTEFLALAALVCYIGAFRGRTSSWVFRHHVLTTIGGMCYSIYLLHYSIEMALGTALRHLPAMGFIQRLVIESLITLPIVLVVAGLFFVLLERPCMDPKWVSRLRQGFRQRTATQPAPAGSV